MTAYAPLVPGRWCVPDDSGQTEFYRAFRALLAPCQTVFLGPRRSNRQEEERHELADQLVAPLHAAHVPVD